MKKTVYVHGYDFNASTDEVRLDFDSVVESIDPSLFTVVETKQATDFTKVPEFPVVITDEKRIVENTWYVDEKGEKTEEKTDSVMLKLNVDPEHGSPLLFCFQTFFNTWSEPYEMRITFDNQEIICTKDDFVSEADDWRRDTFEASNGQKYAYAHYEPEGGSENLVIWLHGIGEGGTENTDPRIVLLANKANVLKSDEFQKTIGKANVLVPQCPTFWMDNTGKGLNLNSGAIQADGTSFYTESLLELIRAYMQEHNVKKTVVTGCSNGGYMTMVLAMRAPELFDGYVPICEAVPDEVITDEQVKGLAQRKMYFVYAKDDATVVPEKHEVPLLERLKQEHAQNIHVSVTDHVIDLSGTYFLDENRNIVKEDTGVPYMYNGHWSWIYFFNNQCDADGLKAWDFIADCLK